MSARSNIIPEGSLIKRKRSSFTKSVDLAGVPTTENNIEYTRKDDIFCQSVHVLSTRYEQYEHQKSGNSSDRKKSVNKFFNWLKGSKNSKKKGTDLTKNETVSGINYESSNYSNQCCSVVIGGNHKDSSQSCSCSKFHHHTFESRTFFLPTEISDSTDSEKFSSKFEFIEANQRHLNLCNTFWRPSLSLNQQNYGNRATYQKHLVNFESLWPEDVSLRSLLADGLPSTALRDAISELALLAVVCGPVHLLVSLIKLSLVRLDCHLEDGQGLLHYACLMQRPALIQFLTRSGVLPELPDRRGYTADETCFSAKTWRQLPSKYHVNTSTCPSTETLIIPSFHDTSVLFRMAQMTGNVYEIQIHLQTMNFNVNTECNKDGDFLIHVAVRGGLCQLPLVMTLVRIQHADIELCNSKGMTPLMITAQAGNSILCDVLICVLGAHPNKVNVENGRSALHYAAQNNHEDVVSCLIKRGIDINSEDYHGCLPDDVPTAHQFLTSADCKDIIRLHRKQRQTLLSNNVINGHLTPDDLVESDLCTVNDEGYTLVMLAARNNRVDNLVKLLDCSRRSIDAQYSHKMNGHSLIETGMTALAMAAQLGHKDVVKLLLLKGSNPGIADMFDDLPLHHAVKHEHEEVVDVMLEFFPSSYKGLRKAEQLCISDILRQKIQKARHRRQEEIVSPGLFEFSIDGKADQLFCLLEDGDSVDCKSGFGSWPLYLAIQNGYLDVIRLLCEKGADLRKRHLQTGNTVLHLSASLARLDVLEYLLNFCKPHYGVDVGRTRRSLSINGFNKCHKTALQLAAEKGYLKIVRCLLHHGATTALLDPKGSLFSVQEFEGVWNEIVSHRQKHTDIIMSLIEKDSKHNFEQLRKEWVPGFDHNLRNHRGDTPLMVASSVGNVDVVLFLLQSAVYPQSFVEDDEYLENFSDNDSGVSEGDLTRTPIEGECHRKDEVKTNIELISNNLSAGPHRGETLLDIKAERDETLHGDKMETLPSRVDSLLLDIDKPAGLSIYHDGLVSHVCAINRTDGSTVLHRCVLTGDNFQIMELLLKIDDTCINIQNTSGHTPLHLACQLERKKCVEKLIESSELDLNVLTLDGSLPEEMTTNKNIIKIIQRRRKGNPVRHKAKSTSRSSSITNASTYGHQTSTEVPSTINLEKVRSRFEAMKHNLQKNS